LRLDPVERGISTQASGDEMLEIERFSALVADIYAASLDPSLWTGVLEEICAFVPAAISNIFVQDGVVKRANVGFDFGLQAPWNELYLMKYVKLNPAFPALLFCDVGEIFCSSNLVPATRIAQTLFYREYLQPQGLGETAGAVLEKSATRCAVFAVILTGSLGPVDEQTLRRMRLLIPHVQRAVLVGKTTDLPRMAAENQKAALSPWTFPELIARQFRLTPTELAVMSYMIELGGVPEAANVLGLPLPTVKTHLLSILAKTGIKDQNDLSRFVAHLANPAAQ
jgi:DNA-binding CsgD family transcriptional regulator